MFNQDELRRHLRPAAAIGMAVVASLVLYLGLVEVLRAVYRPFRGFVQVADIQPVRYAFFGTAIIVMILIRILRPRLMRTAPQADPGVVLVRLQRTAVLTMVLGEVPGILGLVLFLLSGYNVDFYILLFASLILVFMFFPRRAAWEEWSEQ